MFSFLKKTKIKKAQSAGNDNKENNVYDNPPPPPTDVLPAAPGDVCPPNEKIHVETDDKLVYVYPSSDASPRDLSSSSLPPKAGLPHTMGAPSSLSQLGRSDLSRVLTSGYLNAGENMGYMKRAGHEHTVSPAKSLQFHQPVGFSYNRTQTFTVPGTKKGMKALVTGSTKIRKVHCSTPPSVTSTPNHESTTEEEPIALSRYSGGFIPDPDAPKKIESMDWPAPIALQAVPELMKPHRSHSESRSHHSDTLSDTIEHEIAVESLAHDAAADDDNELRHDEKLDKDISEMSKIKESSGMAHALLEDLRIQEKIISRQLPLDPWKASRSPSAAIEPPRRCRFESPTFASPSRRVHTHSSSTTNQDDSLAGLSASIFTTPAGGKRTPLARYQQRSETLVLRPDDSLSPSPKNQTLSNRPDIQRSCDLESTTNSSFSNDGEQNKSSKTVNVDATSTQSRHAHSTHSAPALMSNPKIYPYDELRVLAKKRLPSDVDRDHLERHLVDDDFHRLFQMTRMEYYRLPEWRRVDLKKRLKLF